MIKINNRGSILVHVLVTGVIVAFISAGLLQMVLMNYVAVDRAGKGAQNRKESESMLNRALSYWNLNGICTSVPSPVGVSPADPITCVLTGPPGNCNCNCTGVPRGGPSNPTITAAVVSGQCSIAMTSSNPD